ncbi:hypothetical protein TUN199_04906 [Pyrenophora tritici-repentis]|uniref:Uncharacterized protein n=1 Tax=Pyrenophora tritici-repentis TaxID=45151 RepID=A0A5M9L100_9PLEO|nr:hypothetical protein PtrV1_07884 [Pyrenophora tritici-repentis]KAF7448929.1 hypothetical protein A1F99_059780 [Pyrenophora tritici-repentis]KAF7571077.1 hypothetical protein PtrM4_110790 [Pyrenophora tritici-repentis]KAI0571363.1 hypothetical protein Alg215_10448 [Pyrenophora tritici-repentis]KAI0591402.1 hypothetical protein Alg130_01349 [Pyrenophora tritici-repentis]
MLFSVSFALLLASISQSTLAEVVEIDKAYNVECQGRKTVPNYCTAAGGDFRSIPVETWQGSRTGSLDSCCVPEGSVGVFARVCDVADDREGKKRAGYAIIGPCWL